MSYHTPQFNAYRIIKRCNGNWCFTHIPHSYLNGHLFIDLHQRLIHSFLYESRYFPSYLSLEKQCFNFAYSFITFVPKKLAILNVQISNYVQTEMAKSRALQNIPLISDLISLHIHPCLIKFWHINSTKQLSLSCIDVLTDRFKIGSTKSIEKQ